MKSNDVLAVLVVNAFFCATVASHRIQPQLVVWHGNNNSKEILVWFHTHCVHTSVSASWSDKWLVNKIDNCWVEAVHHFESHACPNSGSEPARRNEKWSASAASTPVSVFKVKRRVMLDNFINRDAFISLHCTCQGRGEGHKVRATPWSEIVIGKKKKSPLRDGPWSRDRRGCGRVCASPQGSMSALMFPQGLTAK